LENAAVIFAGNALATDIRKLQEKIAEHGLKPD